jgi:hypothetical protein
MNWKNLDFIVGLERDYPSTVTAITKTSAKVAPVSSDVVHVQQLCWLCRRPIQADLIGWRDRIAIRQLDPSGLNARNSLREPTIGTRTSVRGAAPSKVREEVVQHDCQGISIGAEIGSDGCGIELNRGHADADGTGGSSEEPGVAQLGPWLADLSISSKSGEELRHSETTRNQGHSLSHQDPGHPVLHLPPPSSPNVSGSTAPKNDFYPEDELVEPEMQESLSDHLCYSCHTTLTSRGTRGMAGLAPSGVASGTSQERVGVVPPVWLSHSVFEQIAKDRENAKLKNATRTRSIVQEFLLPISDSDDGRDT